jgi:hypothetical protein
MCPHLDIPLQIKKKNYKTLYKKVVNAYPHHRVLVHYKHRQALVRD